MDTPLIFAIIIIIIIIFNVIIFYNLWKEKKDRKSKVLQLAKEIKIAIKVFNENITYTNGYFSNYVLNEWAVKYNELYEKINHIKFEDLKRELLNLNDIDLFEKIIKIKTKDLFPESRTLNNIELFKKYFPIANKIRENYNIEFVNRELIKYSHFFNHIEGKKLDEQQRKAIIINEDRNLIIAGAGSGKTTTIVGKVQYLLERYRVSPDEILLISFTNKAVDSLATRLDNPLIEAMTFNKLGKRIIEKVEGRVQRVYDSSKFENFIENEINTLIENDNYLSKLIKYFTEFDVEPKTAIDFESQAKYFRFLKEYECRPYKSIEVFINGTQTFAKETVKSIEECKIANFLFLNGIEYKYEEYYEHSEFEGQKFSYKPDFTIIQNGKKYYLEHFAISRDGKVPSWFRGDSQHTGQEIYITGIKWKRKMHKHFETTLIETYSFEMSNNTLLQNLEKKLKALGIKLDIKSPREVWEIINRCEPQGKKLLIKLISTFIIQLKSNEMTINSIANKILTSNDAYFKIRNDNLLKIIDPIYKQYNKMLIENNEIDFTDMIVKSAKYVQEIKYPNNYKYIIIDEFQDLSKDRYKLITELLKNNPACKLFCVGDDWQSIYRFAGSDIALFNRFENYFGFSSISLIESTYRFGGELIKSSSNFILKNPTQTQKKLNNPLNINTSLKIHYAKSKNSEEEPETVINILKELLEKGLNPENLNLMILSRYQFDIKRLCESGKFKYEKSPSGEVFVVLNQSILVNDNRYNNIKIPFLTIHKAKGLEADYVIVINCNSGKYGFPSGVADDPILNILLTESDQYEHGEERRLFYVAMTRAKKKLYLVTDEVMKSTFISEIEEVNNLGSTNKKCIYCDENTLINKGTYQNRSGNKYNLWGCTNYRYGCEYVYREYVKE